MTDPEFLNDLYPEELSAAIKYEEIEEAMKVMREKQIENFVTDAMVKAYLKANSIYWFEADKLPKNPTQWINGNVHSATKHSLRAALAVQEKIMLPSKFQVFMITEAYEAGVGKGMQFPERGEISNPWGDEPCREAWGLGYAHGKDMATRVARKPRGV